VVDRTQAERRDALYQRAEAMSRSGSWALRMSDMDILFSEGCWEVFGPGSKDKMQQLSAWVEAIHDEDRARTRAIMEHALATRGPYHAEYRINRTDGEIVEIEAWGEWEPDRHGGPGLFRGVFRDVTARKEAERAMLETRDRLRQAQKMEAVGQLTAGVAHDFNNLLAVVMGNLDLLADLLRHDASAQPYLRDSLAAVERGRDLTHRLLSYSRQQALAPTAVDLNHLITRMGQLLSRTLGETIEVEVTRSAGLWLAEVDPGEIEDTILNLALNARDAMPHGGKLTIETANARLDDAYAAALEDVPPGQYVLLAVTDTGTGMAPEVLERAFEPFFSTKREEGRGSGLGLSMVYGFVKQSKGHIRIYSELGEGTSVKIYLPRIQVDQPAHPPRAEPRPESPRGEGQWILVIEDDPRLLSMVCRMLEELGYRVVSAASSDEGLQRAREASLIDAVLTDVVLPGTLRGRELARAIEEVHGPLPVLFMSGYTQNSIVHQGRLDAGVELLRKPFRKDELARALGRVLTASTRSPGADE